MPSLTEVHSYLSTLVPDAALSVFHARGMICPFKLATHGSNGAYVAIPKEGGSLYFTCFCARTRQVPLEYTGPFPLMDGCKPGLPWFIYNEETAVGLEKSNKDKRKREGTHSPWPVS